LIKGEGERVGYREKKSRRIPLRIKRIGRKGKGGEGAERPANRCKEGEGKKRSPTGGGLASVKLPRRGGGKAQCPSLGGKK